MDATATLGVYVDISANFNMQTGVVTWVLTALDPTTLDLPSDPLLGLLPPDTNAPDGQGFVSYSVNPKAALVTGTKINAQATVIFDTNAPINTAPDYNTIDSGPPTSIVTALPATTSGPTFTVSWSGHDDAGGSGIASYSVYVSDNGGSYTPFQTNTTALSAPFTGEVGHTYSFYSVATDNVGNVQATPTAAQATTTVTAAVVSLSASTIATSPASIQAAGTDTVTLTARDTDGSLDTSGTLTVAFQVSSGPGGSFGQVTYEGNGTYTATFTAGDAVGTDTITGTIGGQSVTSTAPTVTVTPGAVSLSASTIAVSSPSILAGGTDTLTLTAVDAFGNLETGGGLTVAFQVNTGPGGTIGQVSYEGNGTYTATFTAGDTAGTDTIAATIGGQLVTSTPPTITVTVTSPPPPGSPPPPSSPPPPASPPLVAQPILVGGLPNGTVQVYTESNGTYTLEETLQPFGNIPTDVRTAVGDVNGDGIPDFIFAIGPSPTNSNGAAIPATATEFKVMVLSGASGNPVLVQPFDPFLPNPGGSPFTAGGFVSVGDFLSNGRDQIVVSPDQQGGPRIAIYDMNGAATAGPQPATPVGVNTTEINPGSGLTRINNFLSVNAAFRGGARTAVGDLNGDGVPDLAIAAGFGGGPAVLVINGTKVPTTTGFTPSDDLIGNFFAFNSTLRDGAYLAIGDVLGNGQQDLILGPGAGGPAEVEVLSGEQIVTQGAVAAIANPVANFVPTGLGPDGSGMRVAVDPTGNGDQVNVVVGAGRNMPGVVKVYPATGFTSGSDSEPTGGQLIDPFGGGALTDGIFVG